MLKNDTILIGTLALTAILLGVLCFGSWQSDQAIADAPDRVVNGDYIMVTGAVSGTHDLVYVIDVPHQRLLVYGTDALQNNITVVDDRVNLAEVFRSR